jgi:outer membrane protein
MDDARKSCQKIVKDRRWNVLAMTMLALIAGVTAAQPGKRPPVDRASNLIQRSDTVRLGLEEALNLALTRNLDLLSSLEGLRSVNAQLMRAHSAFDPEVQLEPGYAFSEQMQYPADGRVRVAIPSRRYAASVAGTLPVGTEYRAGSTLQSTVIGQQPAGNTHELRLSLTQPLLRGFGVATVQAPIRAAQLGIAAAEGRHRQHRNEIVADLTAQYMQLVWRERQRESALRSLRRAEDLERAYAELRALARVTEIDLLTARYAVANRRATLLSADRDRRDAQDALVFAIYGADATAVLRADEVVYQATDTTIAIPELPTLSQAITGALAARPDVMGAQHDVEQARVNEQVARNSLLPTLNLDGSVAATGVAQSGWSVAPRGVNEGHTFDWGLGLIVSYPLRASRARADVEEARAVVNQSDLAVESARNTVQLEVRAAYRAIVIERERLAVQRDATRLARAQYDGERERLRLGVTDLFRVLQFEDAAADAELAELAAAFDLATAVARYTAATGGSR